MTPKACLLGFKNPGFLPDSRTKPLKGCLRGRRGSSASLAQTHTHLGKGHPDTPSSAGRWKSPFLFLGLPVTGTHLHPARATPGEATASAWSRVLCRASSNYFPPLLPDSSILPRIPPPPTPHNLPPKIVQACPYTRGNEHQRCPGGVHSSCEAVERLGDPIHIPHFCTQKHQSAQEGDESQKVNLNTGPCFINKNQYLAVLTLPTKVHLVKVWFFQ